MEGLYRRPAVRSGVFDTAISLSVLALGGTAAHHPYGMLCAAVMAAGLLVRRRFPLVAMGVVGAAALVQVLTAKVSDDYLLPFDLAVLIAMYSAVKYAGRIWEAYAAGLVVAAGIAIEVSVQPVHNAWIPGVFMAAVCTGVWMTGYTIRNRRRYVTGLEERAATLEREREALTQVAIAEERAVIAREMHDVVAHGLAVIIVQADGGRYAMASDPEKGRQTLETVAATAREALDEMRRLIDLLRGGPAGDEDADRRPIGRDRLYALVERARTAGLAVSIDSSGLDVASATTSADLAAYRIVQEALTNVLRHAGPQATVTISAHRTGEALEICVEDSGGPRQPTSGRVGHGLVGMRERVAVHGGTFEAGPFRRGWRVRAVIPAPAAHAPAGPAAGPVTGSAADSATETPAGSEVAAVVP